MKTYTTVFRAYSAVKVPPDQSINFLIRDGVSPPIGSVVISTAYGEIDGVGSLSMFLMVEVTLQAPTLDDAMDASHSWASGLLSFLAFATNAAIGDLSVELCYEADDDVSEHEFFQYFIEMPPLMIRDRLAPAEIYYKLLFAVFEGPEQPRIFRAVQQYELAMSYRRPGQELLALAHLWMSLEALTKVLLRREISRTGSEARLLLDWAIDKKELDSEVRRRLIFRGDSALYGKVRKASDAFEHGFQDFGLIRRGTAAESEAVYTFVRHAILDVVDLDAADVCKLKSEPYSQPIGVMPIARQLRAVLTGPGRRLAAPGCQYPQFRLESKILTVAPQEDGSSRIESEEDLNPSFGPDVAWELRSFGV